MSTTQQNTLKTLKALCTEFGISRFGSKQEILRRLSRNIMRLRDTTSLAKLRRSIRICPAEPLKDQKRPKPEDVAIHNLTHLPYASWCPVCCSMQRKGALPTFVRTLKRKDLQDQHSVWTSVSQEQVTMKPLQQLVWCD